METKKVKLPRIILIASIISVLIIASQIIGVFTIELEEFAIALALVPLILGAVWCGPKVGAILGVVFAITVLFTPSTWTFLKADPFATVVIVISKGALAGYVSGLVYQLLTRVNKIFATFIASTVCPLVNTCIFMAGSVVLLKDNVFALSGGRAEGLFDSISWFWSIVADNFIFEFAYAVIATPIIFLIIDSIRHYIKKKYMKNKRYTHHRRPHYPNQTSEGK